MPQQTVILADDHRLVRAGLRSLIEAIDGYQVLAEADDGERAVELATLHRPSVVTLDIAMPRMNGIEALPLIKRSSPSTAVLIVSMSHSADSVMQALRAGADGYLLKDAAAQEFGLALESLSLGRYYLSPAVSSAVVSEALARGTAAPPPAPALAGLPLTPRQTEILKRLVLGHSMKVIAYELGLSVKTVEAHRAQIMERLGIHNVPQLVLFAVRRGLVSPLDC